MMLLLGLGHHHKELIEVDVSTSYKERREVEMNMFSMHLIDSLKKVAITAVCINVAGSGLSENYSGHKIYF